MNAPHNLESACWVHGHASHACIMVGLAFLLGFSCTQPATRTPVAPTLVKEVPPETKEYRILRSDYEQVIKDGLQNVMRWYFLKPSYNGDRFIGFRVKQVVNSSLAEGPLFVGDILLSVNDMPIERPDHAMAVWRSLWGKKTLKLRLLRNGREIVYEIPIVDEPMEKEAAP